MEPKLTVGQLSTISTDLSQTLVDYPIVALGDFVRMSATLVLSLGMRTDIYASLPGIFVYSHLFLSPVPVHRDSVRSTCFSLH